MPLRPSNALMTYEDFVIACPEFGAVDRQLIDNALQEGSQDLDPVMWGTLLASGHKYITAHILASSPMGQDARLIPAPDGRTTYLKEFERLQRIIAMGGRVA